MVALKVPVSRSLLHLMVDGAAQLGIIVSECKAQQFGLYLSELLRWNSSINLTGITDGQQIIIKHFLDSLAYLKVLELQGDEKLIDIGTGAGFPGIPLKLVSPKLQLVLLDARIKRVAFLKHLSRQLKLEGVLCVHGRAEELAHHAQHYQQYNVAVARAVTQLDRLIALALPYIVCGGRLLVSYGAQIDRQLELAAKVLDEHSAALEKVAQVKLPHSNEVRNIIVIRKCFT